MADKLNIALEDLYVPCPECGGAAHYSGPPKQQGGGLGRRVVHVDGSCEACGGRGGKLTPSGESLYKFFQMVKNNHKLGPVV